MRSFMLTAFAALFVAGLGVAGYRLLDDSTSQDEALTQQPPGVQATEPTPTNQPAVENVGPVEVSVIPTDDPFYLECMEKPLSEGETKAQRTSYCNQELQDQQERYKNHRLSNGDESFGVPRNSAPPPTPSDSDQ